MSQEQQRVRHADEAMEFLAATERDMASGDSYSTAGAALAQVHASLAIAEQLERLNGKLDGTDFGQFLDLLREDIGNIVWRNTGGGK